MCFAFFRAQGAPIGDSLGEEEGIELAAAQMSAGPAGLPPT